MKTLCLDAETFYSDDFTLKKYTTEAYVRDPQFECLGFACVSGNEAQWVPQESLKGFFASIDWDNTCILAHHAQFDGLILAHHFNVCPRYWLDTMSMARLVNGTQVPASLASLAAMRGLPEKTVPYNLFKGRRWCNIDESTRRLIGEGAIHDAQLTQEICNWLLPQVPQDELFLIDRTVRMFTEPKLVGDVPYLQAYQHAEAARKNQTLLELGVSSKDLASADKFAALLEAEGIDVEYKPGKNGEVPCFAKTDQFMKDLLDHEDDTIATLAEARLDVKSTIDETRAGRLTSMARRGPMPVYLSFCGAHTKRDSGGDSINWQNFKRSGELKKGICAPPGYLIAEVDSSQIECRFLNEIAGQTNVTQAFREKRDIYSELATKFYGFEVTKADKPRRGVGKQLELSCGYGASETTIIATAKRGTYGPAVLLSPEEGLRAKTVYRDEHSAVVNLWGAAKRMISALAGTPKPIEWGPCLVDTGRLYGPSVDGQSRIWITYDDLRFEHFEDKGQPSNGWRYKSRKGRVKLYGGKLVENMIQFVSRIDTFSKAVKIIKASGLSLVNREHDKLVFLVKNDQYAQATLDWLLEQMQQPPAWLPSIPLDAEGSLSERYG